MAYFELRTPRDMLEKAERELQRFRHDRTIDNLFNFFVTAYHVRDYVREATTVPQHALDSFLADSDLQDCRALCNKGKHLRLEHHPEAIASTADGGFSGAAFSEVSFCEGQVRTLFYGRRAVDVHALPERVIQKWKRFLAEHGL